MTDSWLATLAEVRRQAARVAAIAGVQPLETDGTWYDVAAGRVETSDLETLDESGAWRGLQWLNAFEVLFFERPKELMGNEQPDDLLFFIINEAYQGDTPALLVRRKGACLPEDLGRGSVQAERIDWCRTVLLNLVIQASFVLTVATCRRLDIQEVTRQEMKPPPDASRVSKAVYASPMNVNVNLEGQRSTEERPMVGYPDISFAVEDFDNAFKSLILTEPGWCYVVSLSATGGMALAAMPGIQAAAFAGTGNSAEAKRSLSGATSLEERLAALNLQPPPADASTLAATKPATGVQLSQAGEQLSAHLPQQLQPFRTLEAATDDPLRRPGAHSAPAGMSEAEAGEREDAAGPTPEPGGLGLGARAGTGSRGPRRVDVPLFTGFVSYEQLEEVIGSGWERRMAAKKEMTHWIKMKGPGGQGHADVATTSLPPLDEGHLKAAVPEAAPRPRQGGPFSRALDAVAKSAADAAKGLVRDVLGSRDEGEHLRLRCALMRLSLPIDLLATQLLQLPLLDQLPP